MPIIVTPRKNARPRFQTVIEGESRTKQAHKDECDVNLILKKYQKTQMLSHVNKIQGSYGDFSNVTEYQDALNSIIDANDRFMGLPASVRSQFGNDPANLIAFVSDDKNYEKAVDLGLINPEKSQEFLSKKNSPPPSQSSPETKSKAASKSPQNDD